MTYSEKLRDPRWQKLRLKILERDNWTCQSCGETTKNLQVHHLLYAKRDPWDYPDEAYQTLCEDCHRERQRITDALVERFRLGLRDIPTEDLSCCSFGIFGKCPPKPDDVLNIYLAGKIAKHDWRSKIVSEMRDVSVCGSCWADGALDPYPEVVEGVIFGKHNYVGPFFVSCDHGCFHGPNSHGQQCIEKHGANVTPDEHGVHRRAIDGIRRCDMLFAFVESNDCYGTLFEIGFAQALRRRVVILAKEGLDDLWFPLMPSENCQVTRFTGEADPSEFLKNLLSQESSHGNPQ